jgi:hypothetical protein
MKRHMFLLAFGVLGSAAHVFGADRPLGRPAAPAARSHDRSYGSWTDLANPWDYFPPAGIVERQKMLAWAERLYRNATILENTLRVSRRSQDVPPEVQEVGRLRLAAWALRQDLLFGADGDVMRARLITLDEAMKSRTLRESTDSRVQTFAADSQALTDRIVGVSGPWPTAPKSLEIRTIETHSMKKARDVEPSKNP